MYIYIYIYIYTYICFFLHTQAGGERLFSEGFDPRNGRPLSLTVRPAIITNSYYYY